MGDNVPTVFEGGGDIAAQYSWKELATDVGYITFYCGGATHAAAAKHYFLTTQATFDADPVYISWTGFAIDEDFDITFEVPMMTAVADIIVNATHGIDAGETGNFVVTVKHVSGGVETVMGTATAEDQAPAGTGWYRRCLKIPLTAKYNFKIGDILRVTITATTGSSGGQQKHLGIDPASLRTQVDAVSGATIGTDLRINIPFKVRI